MRDEQFLSRDPISPLTRDAYGYAASTPLNATDPSGLAPWDDAWDLVEDAVGTGVGMGRPAVEGLWGMANELVAEVPATLAEAECWMSPYSSLFEELYGFNDGVDRVLNYVNTALEDLGNLSDDVLGEFVVSKVVTSLATIGCGVAFGGVGSLVCYLVVRIAVVLGEAWWEEEYG